MKPYEIEPLRRIALLTHVSKTRNDFIDVFLETFHAFGDSLYKEQIV